MTVAENIVYGLKLRKMDSATIKKKLDEILATTRLAPLAQRYRASCPAASSSAWRWPAR